MLTFDPEKHEYRLDGNVIPSVTQVLTSAGIIDHKFSAPGAMERGTDAHQAIEFWNQGDLDEDTLAEDLRGYLTAWKKFVGDYKTVQGYTEYATYHPILNYAGTIDYITKIEGVNYIIDIKTGAAQPWHALQLAAYCECCNVKPAPICLAVYLSSDGTYKAPKLNMFNAWETFRSALNIFNYKERG